MAGGSHTPWYVMTLLKMLSFALACLAAMMALRLGGVIGWTGFGLGVFAMIEVGLWSDYQWPDLRS